MKMASRTKRVPEPGIPVIATFESNVVVASTAASESGLVEWFLMNESGGRERKIDVPPDSWREIKAARLKAIVAEPGSRKSKREVRSPELRMANIPEEAYVLAVRYLQGETLASVARDSGLSTALLRKHMLALCQEIGRREGKTFENFHSMKPWVFMLVRSIRAEQMSKFGLRFKDQPQQ